MQKEQLDRPRRRRAPLGYLTVWQATERYEFAPSTLYHRIETGELPASEWRGVLVIAKQDAEAFVRVKPRRSAAAAGEGAQ
jgi:hypothetical protein